MGIVEQFLLQLKIEKRRWRRAVAILTVLSLFVATGVSWNLRMTGVTIANGATCGQQEHQHSQECPMEKVLICGFDDEIPTEPPTQPPTEPPPEIPTELPTEPPTAPPTEPPTEPAEEAGEETLLDAVVNLAADALSGFFLTAHAEELSEEAAGHVHTDECWEIIWKCGLEEHIHEISCYSDTTADVESAVIWEAGLPGLTGDWADDMVRIAKSQLGFGESERNYQVAGDGETRNGITRYGQWYGNPYGDWSSMFVLFCLNYAQVPQAAVPWSPGVYNMMRLIQDAELLQQPEEDSGSIGSLLFLDTDGNSNADRTAIICAYEDGGFTAIVGDWENEVARITIPATDPGIKGAVNLRQLQKDWKQANASELTEPDDGAEEPAISLDVEFPEEGILRLVARVNQVEEAMYTWQWQYSQDGKEPWINLEGAAGLVCELENTEENFNRYYRLVGQKLDRVQTVTDTDIKTDFSGVTEEEAIVSGAIAPFSISKDNNNRYTIQVYALPVDSDGNRITGIAVTGPETFRVQNTTKIQVKDQLSLFDADLGTYHSAYFGTESSVTADKVASVWRYTRNYYTYYLAYADTDGNTYNQWRQNADNSISLYLRYIPKFTVTFESEGFTTLTERVEYNSSPTLTEPGTWTREGYTLLGWAINDNDTTLYTFDQIKAMPVTANVKYTAKWANEVTVSYDLGEYADALNPIDPMVIPYGSSISPLPTPIWKNNSVAMAFDGWYLDAGHTQPVTAETKFTANTTLYAKWSPKEDGYYVYFMDFDREGQVPLVLVTSSVTEGRTVFPHTPGNAPAGTEWNGTWYLDSERTKPYNFSIPVSNMTEYLTGANGRDLYLYPGTRDVCRAIFVTYGTKVDPVTVVSGGTVNLDEYVPERTGYIFKGWKLKDGTKVSGVQTLTEDTTFYAIWEPDYVPFEAVLRIENANDTDMTQATILGTWYAKAGSQIIVKSTYSNSGDSRTGTHKVYCVVDGKEYPVYNNAAKTQQATLSDVYATYFIYNNTGTKWTDEVNWDDVYTNGELPYSTRPVGSSGDTIINFDYMRVRNDIVFTIPNTNTTRNPGGYIDVYKLQQDGLITGSVIYDGTKPTANGKNVSAHGVSAENISWSYTAATGTSGNNYYTLHNMKYGQRIYEVYPVGGSWLTPRSESFHWYKTGTNELFSSRREDLSADFFTGSGRQLTPTSLTAVFDSLNKIALMYAIECLPGETADFTINGVGYKVQTQLSEVVNHDSGFQQKALLGCEKEGNASYKNLNTTTSKLGDTSVKTLFGTTYWDYYKIYDGVNGLSDIYEAYIFYYTRLHMNLQFNFAYDANGNGAIETETYSNIPFGMPITEYQYGAPGNAKHSLLQREGYRFMGWMDSNGFVLEAEDWESIVATGDSENNTMIFMAKWEKISNNIVEYYEDRSSTTPFESHFFEDGELVQYPTMSVYPEGWVWQESGEEEFERFDWDVPMYGEYGVPEVRIIDGEERVVNVVRVYGTWNDANTKVAYDPNPPQGGIPGTAPTDPNEYTIWKSEVPVAAQGATANSDPNMVFVGWQLDKNGVVYQPGDHVPVQWPRLMTFKAQWAKPEEVVHLRYHPNGGSPEGYYPSEEGFPYKKNATAAVWDNTKPDGGAHFQRPGYAFVGWNTEPDGTGTAYPPDSTIVLTEPMTTLYAQWKRTSFNMSLTKVDSEDDTALAGAEFKLYRNENGTYYPVGDPVTTGADGKLTFLDLQMDTLYKLVEEKSPDGYAIMTKEIFFALRPDENAVALKFYDSKGKEISAPSGVAGQYISGDAQLNLTVENLRGYELPSTGSSGMLIHILCGMVLILLPLVYGISLRRKNERRLRE